MKKGILLLLSIVVASCQTSHKDYEANKALAEKWVETFETENMDLWDQVVSKDVMDVSPIYGMGRVGYQSSRQIAEFYVNNYTDVKFNDPVWLPGIDTLSLKPDGSVRAYGTWTGKSKSTGRTFSMLSYHNFDFEGGKIISTGEYFDATGMVNSVGPIERNVVVFTAKVSKKNINKFQELMDSESGLIVTRNYDGCNHLEAFYNEESETYVICGYWDSYEKYDAYRDWRFNIEEPNFADKVMKLVDGGTNGVKVYLNNSNYNFY
tara:strand:- start:14151 stop:14942 length:792 start_codon:yes stop_codon:yes gene_type:complete